MCVFFAVFKFRVGGIVSSELVSLATASLTRSYRLSFGLPTLLRPALTLGQLGRLVGR